MVDIQRFGICNDKEYFQRRPKRGKGQREDYILVQSKNESLGAAGELNLNLKIEKRPKKKKRQPPGPGLGENDQTCSCVCLPYRGREVS